MTGDEDLKSTATRNLFERLRQDILTGQLPYGTQLRQAEVAARFGMSTTPVREAFRELAALGLVVIHQHRGAIVHRPSAHELSHIYETRMLLEPTSVAWSAPRITSEAIEEARKLIEEMREVTTPALGVDMNRRFHSLIAGACGNELLQRMTINLLDLSTPYLVWFRENTEQEFARQAAEHEDILRACQERDPAAAFRASMRHLTRLHLAGDAREQAGAEDRWLPFDMTAFMETDPGQTDG
jgi:DNA-binding GntR family transcriptional regulator